MCVTLCPFWFGNHLDGEERTSCFAWFVFLVSRDCCVDLPLGTVGLRFVIVVFYWSYSLTSFRIDFITQWRHCVASLSKTLRLDVIQLEFILKLNIKQNNWLHADTCPQATNHSTLFWACFITSRLHPLLRTGFNQGRQEKAPLWLKHCWLFCKSPIQ